MIDDTEFKRVETGFEQLFVFVFFVLFVLWVGKTPIGKKVTPNEGQIQKSTENVFILKSAEFYSKGVKYQFDEWHENLIDQDLIAHYYFFKILVINSDLQP